MYATPPTIYPMTVAELADLITQIEAEDDLIVILPDPEEISDDAIHVSFTSYRSECSHPITVPCAMCVSNVLASHVA